jgi:hypothetical protein
MKLIKKKLSSSLIALSTGLLLFPTEVMASSPQNLICPTNITIMEQTDPIIVPYSDIIDWRYKTIGDSLYRRQYNYSKQIWLGEWELC